MKLKPYIRLKYYVMCRGCGVKSGLFGSPSEIESFLSSNKWAKGGDAFVLCPDCAKRFDK